MSSSWDEYLDSLREIPYEEIASATDNFAGENLIEECSDSSKEVYKGQLLLSGQLIDVVVHKFQQYDRIVKEVYLSSILDESPVGFCDGYPDYLVVVKKHFVNGSLEKHLSGSTLTWLQRLQICVDVSLILSCLHLDDNVENPVYFIHGDIRSSNILLDDNWVPNLQGSKFFTMTERYQLYITSEHTAKLQYMDPAYETTGGFTHKSDVFSFGVILFEVLFGRKAEILNGDNWYFARLARLHYEEGKLDEFIDPNLRKQMDLETFNLFSETAYFCLKEDRQQRPDMNQVFKRLEHVLELQKKHDTPVKSSSFFWLPSLGPDLKRIFKRLERALKLEKKHDTPKFPARGTPTTIHLWPN